MKWNVSAEIVPSAWLESNRNITRLQDCKTMDVSLRPTLLRISGVFTFLCVVFTLRLTEAATIKQQCKLIGETKLVDIEGCPLATVRVNSCAGYCFSHSIFNPISDKFMRQATCCRMTDKEYIETKLMCDHGPQIVRIPTAVQCECMDCAPTMEIRRR